MGYGNVLTYFKEALENQEFEQCSAYIDAALQEGASRSQINAIINAYLQGEAKVSVQDERVARNRLKFLNQRE